MLLVLKGELMFPLLILFTVFPAAELYFLIQVGGEIGVINTIFIIVLTGIIGASLAKNQGRAILGKIQKDMAQGKMPADQLIHGFLVFAGGLLLLTPGFVTDGIGLALVFPLTRILFIGFFKSGLEKRMQNGQVQFYSSGSGFSGGFHTSTNGSSQAKPFQANRNFQQDEPKKVYRQNGHDVIDVEAVVEED